MADSIQNKSKSNKPGKPHKDFPLCSSSSGCWQRKINGKIYYFGPWCKVINGKKTRLKEDGWQKALVIHDGQYDDLKAGREPYEFSDEEIEEFLEFSEDKSSSEYRRFYDYCKSFDCEPNILRYLDFEGKPVASEDLTVADICNAFLTAKKHLLDTGEIVACTFNEYKSVCDRLIRVFGKRQKVKTLFSSDFLALRKDIASTRGAVSLGNEIQRVKSVFKFGYEEGLLEIMPKFGQSFKKPSMKVMRKNRAENGKKLFSAKEILLLHDTAGLKMKAMILLGINAALGNTDIGRLNKSHIDFDSNFLDFPRPKTGIERRCPLWPETIAALKTVLQNRPTPKNPDDDNLIFLTDFGNRWVPEARTSTVGKEFAKIVNKLNLSQPGRGFYSLRHTHRTVSDGSKDFPSCNLIMGHADSSIASVYREQIADERLQAVAEHVRNWLFGAEKGGAE